MSEELPSAEEAAEGGATDEERSREVQFETGARLSQHQHQEPAVKAFVVHADSYIGKNVALWLQEHKHEVVGTLGYDPGVKKPYYLTEAFHVPPVKTLKAHSLERPRSRHVRRMEDDRKRVLAACVEASVIVIPLAGNEQLTADILAALGEALDEAQLKEKVVIGITVATTWAKTIPFKTADGDLIPMTEQDLARRRGTPMARKVAAAEHQLLRAREHFSTKGLNTYVLCPGLLYGHGESPDGFFEIFKVAWEAKRAVPLWTDGGNVLPTCHVEDLARTAAAVAAQRPTAQYHVVADAVPVTLLEATSAIAAVFAQEVDESVSRDEALQTPGLDPLMSNFTLAASSGLLDPPPQLKYHELGMLAQMDEAAKSFLVNNNLSPLRVMLWGPPLSGKTALAEVIAKQYSLRRIHAQYLVDEVLAEQDEEFIAAVESRKAVEAASAPAAAGKGAKKGAPPPAAAATPAEPRIADEDMIELCKLALAKPDCQNLGFVLDGFPKTYAQMKELFTEAVEPPPMTEEEAEAARVAAEEAAAAKAKAAKGKKGATPPPEPVEARVVVEKRAPQVVFLLEVTEEEAQARMEAAAEAAADEAKLASVATVESTLAEWKASKAYKAAEKAGQEALAELEPPAALPTTEELTAIADGVKDKARAALSRRQAKWASAAAPPAPLKPAAAIYADYKVCEGDAAKVAVDKELNVGANMDGVLDLIKATLGEPHNFLGFPGPDAALPLTEEQFQAKVAAEAAEAAAKQLETAYQAKLLQMQTEETELAKMRQLQQLRTRAEPVRKAILEGVMPHLTEAMLAVVQRRPDDPVAYVAMLLEQKAAAVAEGHKLVRFGRPNSRGDSKARHAERLEKERRKTSRTTTFDLPDDEEVEDDEAAEAATVEGDASK